MSVKKLIILVTLLIIPGFASAAVITFDSIIGIHNGTYSEAGYDFSLNGGSNPHYGDAATVNQILDWHNGAANAANAIVTMTKSGGGLFDLDQLDVIIQGATSLLINGTSWGAGTHLVNLTSISSVTFDWTFTAISGRTGGIDNLYVNAAAIPEPSIVALFGLGLFGLGFAGRKVRN